MATTLTIIDLQLDMTDEDKITVGSDGQVILKIVITDEDDAVTSEDVEFFEKLVKYDTPGDMVSNNCELGWKNFSMKYIILRRESYGIS